MLELIIYEGLAVVSFFLTLYAILFNPGNLMQVAIVGGIYFIATVIIKLISETYRWAVLLTLSLFLPLFFVGFDLFYVVTPISIIVFMFFLRENFVIEYRHLISSSYGVLATICGLFIYVDSIVQEALERRVYDNAPLLLLYVLASIIFLRTLRYKASKIESAYVRKSNLRFAFMAIVTYILAMVEGIRAALFESIQNTGIWFFSILFKPIYYVMGLFAKDDLSILEESAEATEEMGAASGPMEELLKPLLEDEELIQSLVNFMDTLQAIFQWIAVVVFISFIIYQLIRAFRYGGRRYSDGAGVVMERTQIKAQEKKKKKKAFFFFGKSPVDEIRFLYHKHMHQLDLLDAPDLNTEKVYEKGIQEKVENPERVRDIYRNIRYNDSVTEQEAKQLLPAFKEAIK